jgi:hypothetical protein
MNAGEKRKINAGAIIVACVKLGGVFGAIVGGVACLNQGRSAVYGGSVAGLVVGVAVGFVVGCVLATVAAISN